MKIIAGAVLILAGAILWVAYMFRPAWKDIRDFIDLGLLGLPGLSLAMTGGVVFFIGWRESQKK